MKQDFAENISLLCSYYPSTSEVCRRLSIHRSQFNKYLNGSTRPSRSNMRKICEFFGVEEHEIHLPQHQFSQILQIRPSKPREAAASPYQSHIEKLQNRGSHNLSEYVGYYFEYYYAMSYPHSILRSLIYISESDKHYYYKRIERLAGEGSNEKGFPCRYRGMVFYLSDRLFLVDYESLTQNEISQTVLYPSYKSRTTYLTGLKLGVAAESRRFPTCTRVVYEVLGNDIDVKTAIGLCGLFSEESESIATDIKPLIRNTIEDGEPQFTAKPL